MAPMNGVVEHAHGRTAYRVVGRLAPDGPAPVVVLHGGPGVPHGYLAALEALATGGRAVVFYDQLGCGRSPAPTPPPRWTMGVFLDELEALTRHLGLERHHVLGHSWGGMLAMEHALRRPRGLAGLALVSAPAGMPLHAAEVARLRAALPPDVRATLDRHEAAGTRSDPEYEAASMAFYGRHLCRLDPWPEALVAALGAMSAEVYGTLWGESEFKPDGALRAWDPVPMLHEVRGPALVVNGLHDMVTPGEGERLAKAMPQAERVVIPGASHSPHVEAPEPFFGALEAFFARAD